VVCLSKEEKPYRVQNVDQYAEGVETNVEGSNQKTLRSFKKDKSKNVVKGKGENSRYTQSPTGREKRGRKEGLEWKRRGDRKLLYYSQTKGHWTRAGGVERDHSA